MEGRILIPTNLSRESNSVLPFALTIAQAFPDKVYLLHVMDPRDVNKPERLEDFPRLRRFFALERDTWFVPPLKSSVEIGKLYVYNKDVAKVILGAARNKRVDLICMAAVQAGAKFAWWSAGDTVEAVIEKAPCSVLCVRGRALKEEQWTRPRFRHLLLLTELTPTGEVPLSKVMPWVQRFNSMLHIFPLGDFGSDGEQSAIRELCHQDEVRTNVLLFAKPGNQTGNLLKFIADTPVDLIVMTQRIRSKFSNRLLSDVFVRLLRATDAPVLLLR
jgi:nucleotide-binding universal stress UspA family protein